MSLEEVALGYVQVANEAMCRPIRNLTEVILRIELDFDNFLKSIIRN